MLDLVRVYVYPFILELDLVHTHLNLVDLHFSQLHQAERAGTGLLCTGGFAPRKMQCRGFLQCDTQRNSETTKIVREYVTALTSLLTMFDLARPYGAPVLNILAGRKLV